MNREPIGTGRLPPLGDCRATRPASTRHTSTLGKAPIALSGPRRRCAAASSGRAPPLLMTLSDPETDALTRLLSNTIDNDKYPLSPRIQTLKAILAKIRPGPVREPLPPIKYYAPPRASARKRR